MRPPSRISPANVVVWLLRPTVSVTAVRGSAFSTMPVPASPPMVLLKPLRRSTAEVAPCAERMWVELGLKAFATPATRVRPGKLVLPA